MENGEAYILEKLIKGDETAFKYFFDAYYDDLCNFVNLYIQDEIISEDIVQTIFIDVWEKRESLSNNKSLKSYLFSASKNKSLNYLRDSKTKIRIETAVSSALEDSVDSTSQFMDLEELQQLINRSIENLPEKCREIFCMSRHEELSYSEIAQRLGISIKTVENQISIAFRKIREALQPYHEKIFILFLISTFF